MKTILIIDDDVYIGDMLNEKLSGDGYSVLRAYSGTEALLLLERKRPDLILLDLMLPGLSGEEVLRKISGIPVIVVSAKADVGGKVRLLLGGAADYITKPFDIDELSARIAVQLRKNPSEEKGSALEYAGITLDDSCHSVSVSGGEVRLTRTEYAILKILMQNGGGVVTKSRLLEMIAEDTPDCTENTLKVHVSNLRIKLREKCGRDCIEAVWGIGFKLREEE